MFYRNRWILIISEYDLPQQTNITWQHCALQHFVLTLPTNPYRLLPQVYPTMPSRKMIQARPVKLLPLRSLDLDGC